MLIFYYYDNSEEIQMHHRNHDTSLAKIHLKDVGRHDIHCSYTVFLKTETVKSVESNTVTVAVAGMLDVTVSAFPSIGSS